MTTLRVGDILRRPMLGYGSATYVVIDLSDGGEMVTLELKDADDRVRPLLADHVYLPVSEAAHWTRVPAVWDGGGKIVMEGDAVRNVRDLVGTVVLSHAPLVGLRVSITLSSGRLYRETYTVDEFRFSTWRRML
jgi:hypothetical protein